jgi:flagellar biosynthesis GTPase FlhF
MKVMYSIAKVPMNPLIIPKSQQMTGDMRLFSGRAMTLAKRLLAITACIFPIFSLDALAADTALSQGTPPATIADAGGVHRLTFQERIERMKSMTPKQRIHERELMHKELQKMPPEQQAQQRKEMREQFQKLSPEDRHIARQQFREDINSMTPEERARNQDELRKDWDSMTPEQRAEQRKEMREHWEQMSPEEREQIRLGMKEHWKNMPPEQREERRKEMREHFKNMSPAERQQFKNDMDKRNDTPVKDDDYPGNKADDAAVHQVKG